MSTLCGLQVKSLKKFYGREGEAYQGNLYLNGKKIGFWSQDANGCIVDDVYLNESYNVHKLKDAIKKIMTKKYPNKNPFVYCGLESFMSDYLNLCEDEKIFKREVKKGYAGVVVLSPDKYCIENVVISYKELVSCLEKPEIIKYLKFKYKDVFDENSYVRVYKSKDDFIDNTYGKINIEDII